MNAREARLAVFRGSRERVQAMNAKERQPYGFDPADEQDERDEKDGAS